jgi:tetratricopeptide (TPR) repeat protein
VDITLNFSEMVALVERHKSVENEAGLWKMLLPLALEHIRQHPDFADLYNTLGTLYLKLNQIKESKEAFGKAISINPNYVKARMNLFKLLKEQGKDEEALVHGTYLTETNQIKYPDIITAMGRIHFNMSNYPGSLEKAEMVLKEKADFAPAVLLAAQSLERLGRIDEAKAAYHRFSGMTGDPSLGKQAKEAIHRLK